MLPVIHCPESSTQATISHWFSARPAYAIRVQWDVRFALDNGGERRALGYGRPHAPYYAHRFDQIVCWQREFSPLQYQACQGYIGRIGHCHFPTLIAYAMCRPYSLICAAVYPLRLPMARNCFFHSAKVSVIQPMLRYPCLLLLMPCRVP